MYLVEKNEKVEEKKKNLLSLLLKVKYEKVVVILFIFSDCHFLSFFLIWREKNGET